MTDITSTTIATMTQATTTETITTTTTTTTTETTATELIILYSQVFLLLILLCCTLCPSDFRLDCTSNIFIHFFSKKLETDFKS
jgi:hypothetical protein